MSSAEKVSRAIREVVEPRAAEVDRSGTFPRGPDFVGRALCGLPLLERVR